MKFSILVMSDPKQGDEALGRLFNALAFASEAQRSGDDVELAFQGAGTRWPAELTRLDHPARALYDSVHTLVRGASKACSAVFGATDSVRAAKLPELDGNALQPDMRLNSIRQGFADGRQTLIF